MKLVVMTGRSCGKTQALVEKMRCMTTQGDLPSVTVVSRNLDCVTATLRHLRTGGGASEGLQCVARTLTGD